MPELREAALRPSTGGKKILALVGLVLLLLVVGSFAYITLGTPASAAPAPRAAPILAGHTAPAPLLPHPSNLFPVIHFFAAAPNPVPEFQLTNFNSFVTNGTTPLTFSYTGLPAGCASVNASTFNCYPHANGTFLVNMTVTDLNGNTTKANTTLVVNPYTSGNFFVGNSSFTDQPKSNQLCQTFNSAPFYSVSCYAQSQDPSILSLANGHVGVAYGQYTTATTNGCPGAAANTNSRIGWSDSSDGGHTFAHTASIGNQTCAYLNAIEPSFGVSGSTVYGSFIEENASQTTLPSQYGARAGDALGFVVGTSNGASWSAVRTLVSSGNLARPALATFGNTIYITYEDIANGSTTIGGGWLPISVQFIASTDGGVTWSAPQTLPGLNATAYYDSLSPSIAVNATGGLTVVYATDRSCVDPGVKPICYAYGDNIYSLSSSSNGTTWGPLQLVATGIGESTCYSSGCLPDYYQSTPETAVTTDAAGHLYVLFAGTFDDHTFNPATNYRWTGIWYSVSINGGVAWTTVPVAVAGEGNTANFFNPGIGIHSKNVVITYSGDNETIGTGYLDSALTQWFTNTTTGPGKPLTPAVVTSFVPMPYGRLTNFTRNSFVGYGSAVGFDSGGSPLLAYSIAQKPFTQVTQGPGYYYTNTTYATNLTFAYHALATNYAQTVNVTFEQTGIPYNVSWEFTVFGETFVTKNSSLTVNNVPKGVEVAFLAILAPHGWQIATLTQSYSTPQVFTSNLTIVFTFSIQYGQIWFPSNGVLPSVAGKSTAYYTFEAGIEVFNNYGYVEILVEEYGGPGYSYAYVFDDSDNYTTGVYHYSDCFTIGVYPAASCLPLYFPAGYRFQLFVYAYSIGLPSYTNGTGEGAISGGFYCYYPGQCNGYFDGYSDQNITVLSPGNQTIWFGSTGSAEFNESVVPLGLPTGSIYHFTWAKTAYSATAQSVTIVRNQTLGAYPVSGIWANSSTAGWEYFGHLDNYAAAALVPWQPNVNLTFDAYEDVAAAPQPLSIHATNLLSGVGWTAMFNGTRYSSDTPWINLTVHPGDYTFGAGNAVSSSGNTGWVAVGVPSTVLITPLTSYVNVTYVPSYEVTASAALGGTLTVNNGNPVGSYTSFVTPGTQVNFTATANPGFSFLGWTGTGTGSYSGGNALAPVTANGPITESANFEALPGARFNLTFQDTGLPAGTQWGVELNGVGYSTTQPSLTVSNLYSYTSGASGVYALAVPPAYANSSSQIRYVAENLPATVSTNGSSTPPVSISFTSEAAVTVTSTLGGFATAAAGGAPASEIWAANGTLVSLAESASNGYKFTSWTGTGPGAYTGTSSAPTFVSAGAPVTELATFTKNPTPPTPHYTLTLNLTTPLEAGTSWSVTLQGVGYSSTGSSIVVPNLLGSTTYSLVVSTAYSPDGLTLYTGVPTNPASVQMPARNYTVPVGFSTDYWVSISASAGGTTTPASGWFPAGKTVALQAIPTGTEQFSKWVGSGSGSYSGLNASDQITVNGPIEEVAEFVVPTHATSTTVTSLWQNVGVLAGLAIAGLIVGLLVGLIALRGGGGGSAPPEEQAGPSTPEGAGGGSEAEGGEAMPEEGQA
jgi:List-Bact-rpt repeat protein